MVCSPGAGLSISAITMGGRSGGEEVSGGEVGELGERGSLKLGGGRAQLTDCTLKEAVEQGRDLQEREQDLSSDSA